MRGLVMKKITLEKIMLFIAILQFIAIVFFNFTKAAGALGLDSSLALRHAMEMWKNGIFLEDFSFFSSTFSVLGKRLK